jgi:polysaccharide export outer membrane protein
LQPGDTIEVTLRYQDGPDAHPRQLGSSNVPVVMGQTDVTAANSLRDSR